MTFDKDTRYCQDCRRQTTHWRADRGSWICSLCGAIWGVVRKVVRTYGSTL